MEIAQPKPWSSATPATNAFFPLRLMGRLSPCTASVAVARTCDGVRAVAATVRGAVLTAWPRSAARIPLGAFATTAAATGDALDDVVRVTRDAAKVLLERERAACMVLGER